MTRLILVMLFAFSGLLHAQTAVNTKILDQCFDFEPWVKNDYNVIAARMFDAVQNSPDDIATLTYINHFGHTLFYTDNPDALGKTLLAISGNAKRLGVLGLSARAFLGVMHEAALVDDDLDTARRIENATLGLQQWLVAGPFGANDGDRHYDVLQPELWVDTKQTMSGAFGPVSWTKWTPELPSRSTVNPQDVFEHDGTGWFLLTQVVNDGDAFEALLDIEVNDGGVKVWLNGNMVFNRRPEADYSRDDSALVQIPKGTSTLLVKLGSLSAATVRICDPKTRLSLESVRSQYPTDMKPFAPRGSVPPASQPIPYRYQRLASLIDSAKDPKVQMQARCLLALELLGAQSPEQAEDLWHEAEGYRKSHPLMEACLDAMYYERTSVATAAEQRRILAERYTWLNANQPGAVVSRLKLANIRVGEDRDGDARKLYDETLAIQPHWAHRTHYAAFFDRRKWQAEARNQRMLAFTETSSRPAQLVLMRAEMAEADGDLELAQELYEQLADGPAKNNTNILDALKRLALNGGDFDTALEYIEAKERILGGATTTTQRERAAILAASGKIAEAFAILMALAERPERGRANRYYDAAMLAYRNGLEKEAREALLKTVERNPGHDNARRYLARLDGKAPQMLSEFSTALDPLQARDWLKAQDYPLASAGWLLDEEVWHVEKDGSFVAYGQTVTKILLQDAVDTHGRQRIDGEVLRARTIKGDGAELEPVTVTGANFEFPGVEPGAVIDTAYRRYTRASTPGVLDDVSFQFEDRDVRTPTALARLVVVTPKDFVVHYREENMEGATFTRRELDDGRVLLSWEMRRPRSRKAEPAMPTRDETMPKVTFYRPGENPWTGAARRLRSSLRATEVTWRVREAAMQALSVLDRDAGDIQKAVALYAWVNSTIRTTGGGTNPHTTVEQKSGDRFALMAAMLDAAGVEYKHVFAGNDPDIETRKPRYLDYA
ncbi:MAG: DUF3857 domain-containing protein, partial [Planctomycetes bacterium]|nr:DUF3857 domain-containing protein [Planctomycetota bacterium]